MNTPLSSAFPRPSAEDADDVVWTLQTAAVQWQRGLRADAIVWIRRAADSATGAGNEARGNALRRQASLLAEHLWSNADQIPATYESVEPESIDVDEIDVASVVGGQRRLPPNEASEAEVQELGADELVFIDDADVQAEPEDDLIAALARSTAPPLAPPPVWGETLRPGKTAGGAAVTKAGPSSVPVEISLSSHPPPPVAPVPPRATQALRAPPLPRGASAPPRPSPATRSAVLPPAMSPLPVTAVAARPSSPAAKSAPPPSFMSSARPRRASELPLAERPAAADDDWLGTFDDVTELNPAPGAMSSQDSVAASSEPTEQVQRLSEPVPSEPTELQRLPSILPADSTERQPVTEEAASATFADVTERHELPAMSGRDEGPDTLLTDVTEVTERVLQNLPGANGEIGAAVRLGGVPFEQLVVFADLPEEAQRVLAAGAHLLSLEAGQSHPLQLGGAGVVLHGAARFGVAEAPGVALLNVAAGGVVAARASSSLPVEVRVTATTEGATLALWRPDQLVQPLRESPWVADELERLTHRAVAMGGALKGPLGQRLDEVLLASALSRFDVKWLQPGERLASAGQPISGLFLVGAGELLGKQGDAGPVMRRWSAGEFVLGESVLGGSPAAMDVTASGAGTLVLVATRAAAHELLMSLPPLIELIVG